MPNLSMFPLQGSLVALATQTTTGTSGVLTLPQGDSYRLFLECDTVSGTSPTLDLFVATSADGGTNFQNILKFAQVTTTGQGRVITFRPYVGFGDTAQENASAVIAGNATVSGATGAAVAINGPLDPKNIKVQWVIGGTTPSFAFSVKWLCNPQDSST